MKITSVLVLSALTFSFSFAAAVERDSCSPGSYYVRAHKRGAYMRADGTLVNSTDVKATCRVRTKTYDFWSTRLSSGRPKGWPHKGEKSADWTEAEKESLLEALQALPDNLQLESIKYIFRMKQSWHPPNHSDSI